MDSKSKWRKAVKTEMYQATLRQSKQKKPHQQFNYRWEHVRAVVTTAVKLAELVGGDAEVVEAAAWLHDVCKEAGEDHPKAGAKFAKQFLPQTDFPAEKIKPVAKVIADHMGLWRNKPLKRLESQILWDADKLTKMGAIAIFHWTGNWVTKNGSITTQKILANGRSVDWMKKTVASMHTEPARRAAQKRYKAYKRIWKQLATELDAADLTAEP